MKLFNDKEQNIFIVGDLNCQSYKLMMKIELRKIENSHLIILGNFGIGTLNKSIEEKNLNVINNKLKIKNNKIYLLRGNLDSIDLFDKYKNKYKNIIFTKDYQIEIINNIKFMFIGGSDSYDRLHYFNHKRIKPVAFREFDITNKRPDIILSHENVDFIYPYNLYNLKPFSKNDKWLYNDIKKKRIKLTDIYKSLKKKNIKIISWYSSKHNVSMIERKNFTNFIQLKKLEIVEFKK